MSEIMKLLSVFKVITEADLLPEVMCVEQSIQKDMMPLEDSSDASYEDVEVDDVEAMNEDRRLALLSPLRIGK